MTKQQKKVQTIGIANANTFLNSSSDTNRKNAYTAINKAWETQKEPCASILNALAG